jgi:hypothetical protein
MHRIGKYGVDRRCKTPEEMKAADMHLNKDGYWAGKGREDYEFND